jgi:hypothetical protein
VLGETHLVPLHIENEIEIPHEDESEDYLTGLRLRDPQPAERGLLGVLVQDVGLGLYLKPSAIESQVKGQVSRQVAWRVVVELAISRILLKSYLGGRVDLVPQQCVNQFLVYVAWELYVPDCGTKHSFDSVICDEGGAIGRHPVLLINFEGVHQHVPFLAPVELGEPACLIFCLEKHAGASELYERLILTGGGRLLRGRRGTRRTCWANITRAAAVHEEEGEYAIFEGAITSQGVKEEGATTLLR